jgi:hypothetical protein
MKILFHHDAGHGWYQVSRADVERLGIQNQISRYSYENDGACYLEEDCDASLLFAALRDHKIAHRVDTGTYTDDSPIRNYPRFAR